MAKPQKILQIKSDDWLKGISSHAGLPVGGIFQTATEFNPFELPGYLRASLSPTTVDNSTLSTEVNAMASMQSSGTGYVVAVGNRASGGAKCVYLINTSNNAVTDEKANVDSSLLLNGAGFAFSSSGGEYFVYADGNDAIIKSVTFPAFGSDTTIEIPTGMNVTNQPVVFAKGPSGYLHYFRGSAAEVGVIVDPTSNSGDNTDDSVVLPSQYTPKDGCTDGRYFIIIGDNNPSRATGVSSDCRVFFTIPGFTGTTPVSTTTWEVSYEIPDQYLIACRYVAGRVYVLGYSGIWETGIGTPPRLVHPLTSTQIPKNPYFVTVHKNIMYWVSNATSATVYGFGNEFLGKPVLFTPYDSSGSTDIHTCLVSAGDYLYAGTNSPKVVAHNYTGASRANTTIQTVVTHLDVPHRFSHMRVTLKSPLSSGQSVGVNIYDANDQAIVDTNTISFTTHGARKSLVFEALPASTPISEFDNFYVQVNPVGGAVVERVTVYGNPIDDYYQTK